MAVPIPAAAMAWTVLLSSDRNTKLGSIPFDRRCSSSVRVLPHVLKPMRRCAPMTSRPGKEGVAANGRLSGRR